MPFLKIFIRWWWTFTKYNRKHFPILENGGDLKCVLTSSASFIWSLPLYKKHMAAAALYLDKEQFLCSIKKKIGALFSIFRDNGGTVEGGGDDLSAPAPVSGTARQTLSTSQSCSFITASPGGCCLGRVCFTPTRAYRVYTWNPGGWGQTWSTAASNGKSSVLIRMCQGKVGMVLKARWRRFSKWEELWGNGPSPWRPDREVCSHIRTTFATVFVVHPLGASLVPSA